MPSANESHAVGEGRSNDEPSVLVRKLSSSSVPTYLERVLTQDGELRFVVVEHASRTGMSDEETAASLRDAQLAAALEHPNVVQTRVVTVGVEEIRITSNYVAGERLSDLWSATRGSPNALPLEIALRILVDVSTGLGALHKLRGTEGHERIKFVHGEVTAANVLVGLDGVTSLLRACRLRRPNSFPKRGIGTLAPEVLAGEAADQRADVYSLGALLWEALSGKPLFADDDVEAILASAKNGTAPPAIVSNDLPWALPLADVAARALAAPDQRFPTASSMITELRKITGPKLATAVQVAEFVEAVAGEKIAARIAHVQASAVTRKATSIPPPRSAPQQATDVAARGSVPAKEPVAEIGGPTRGPTPEASGPLKVLVPAIDSNESKLPMREDSEANIATLAFLVPAASRASPPAPYAAPLAPIPAPPAALSASVPAPAPAPRTASFAPPAPQPSPPAPQPPPPVSVPVPASHATPPAPPARAAKQAKVTAEPAAVVQRPPMPRKASSAVLGAAPSTSSRVRLASKLAIGVCVTVALTTGWLALQAIRNRQEIVTPGATQPDPPIVQAPAATAVEDKAGAARSGVASVPKRDPARATPSTTVGHPMIPRPAPSAIPLKIPKKIAVPPRRDRGRPPAPTGLRGPSVRFHPGFPGGCRQHSFMSGEREHRSGCPVSPR